MARKKDRKQNNDSINKNNNSVVEVIENVLDKISKHKEAITLICVAVSLVATAAWNLACDFGYKGYAQHFGIASQYIQKDYGETLLQFLMIAGIIILVMLPICLLAQYNSNHIIKHWVTIGVSIFISIIPFILFFVSKYTDNAVILPTWVSDLSFILAFISSAFFILYFPISMLLPHGKNASENSNSNSETEESNSNTNEKSSSTDTQQKLKAMAGALVGVIFIVFASIFGSYFIGMEIARSKTDFKFLVDDFSSLLQPGTSYQVILSETDTHYYLADSFFVWGDGDDNENEPEDSGKLTLIINSFLVTIQEKPETVCIRELEFTRSIVE